MLASMKQHFECLNYLWNNWKWKNLECLIRLTRKNIDIAKQFFYLENKIKFFKREFIWIVSNGMQYIPSIKFLNNKIKNP